MLSPNLSLRKSTSVAVSRCGSLAHVAVGGARYCTQACCYGRNAQSCQHRRRQGSLPAQARQPHAATQILLPLPMFQREPWQSAFQVQVDVQAGRLIADRTGSLAANAETDFSNNQPARRQSRHLFANQARDLPQ